MMRFVTGIVQIKNWASPPSIEIRHQPAAVGIERYQQSEHGYDGGDPHYFVRQLSRRHYGPTPHPLQLQWCRRSEEKRKQDKDAPGLLDRYRAIQTATPKTAT